MLRTIILILVPAILNIASSAELDSDFGNIILDNQQCIECYKKNDAKLIDAWKSSIHGKQDQASCTDCHGKQHQQVASFARKKQACISCHDKAVNHSYSTSKHGVIVTLEQREWDWKQPLESGNYRAPTCAYCHLHAGNHGNSQSMDQNQWLRICSNCHSPRYIRTLQESGEKMKKLGELKVIEAKTLLQRHKQQLTVQELKAISRQLEIMEQKHLRNVGLGIGHQSPDYQWWHGHPALDGDLLRIKSMISESQR